MTNEELNTALYKKMFAEQEKSEQEKFEDWLLSQSPREILNHAYEYTMREDILLSLEYNDLTSDQAAALLASPSPLDDLYHQYEKMETSHMEEIWSCFENRAEQVKAAQAVQEKRLNISCKEAHRKSWTGLDLSGSRLSLLRRYRTKTGMPGSLARTKRGPRRCPCRRAARMETGAPIG